MSTHHHEHAAHNPRVVSLPVKEPITPDLFLGVTVIYTNMHGTEMPATVTRIYEDERVSLTGFPPPEAKGAPFNREYSVQHGAGRGMWKWPGETWTHEQTEEEGDANSD